jgi:hypothetical protein
MTESRAWGCRHCGTGNPADKLTCYSCRRIRGSVAVPRQAGRQTLPGGVRPSQLAGTGLSAVPGQSTSRPLALGALGLVLVAAAGVYSAIISASPNASALPPTARAEEPPSVSGTEVLAADLRVGDCFDYDDDAPSVEYVRVAACTDAHRYELVHVVELPGGSYPGLDSIESTALARCEAALEEYTGKPYDPDVIDFSLFYPSEASWASDDRTVQCYAYSGTTRRVSLRGERSASATAPESTGASPRTDSSNTLQMVHVRDLRPGDCWTTQTWEPNEQGNVTTTSCGLRHQFEVIWVGTYTAEHFPVDEATFYLYIDAQCSPAFEDYVGVPWLESPFDVWWTYPTAERWADGDRAVVCSAFDIDGPLSYSIRDDLREE